MKARQIYGSKKNLLKIAKDSVCYSLESGIRGFHFPTFQNFDGYIDKESILELKEELEKIDRSPLELVIEDEGKFVPVKIIPGDKVPRGGFTDFFTNSLRNIYKTYPKLQVKDFIVGLLNECNEALYRKKPLDVRRKLSNLGI